MNIRMDVPTTIAFITGSLMTLNFAVFWAIPVVIQGLRFRGLFIPSCANLSLMCRSVLQANRQAGFGLYVLRDRRQLLAPIIR